MFFKEGEMLTFQGANDYKDYSRYNQIASGFLTSKVGEVSVDGFYKKSERSVGTPSRSLELSLWRVIDNNMGAPERGEDTSKFVISKSNGERVSYVVVPRMNTDPKDASPCEYTSQKDATFEDIDDPRVIVIARSYKGVVAEIAKDLVMKNESAIRDNYKYLADEQAERYCSFSNPQLLTAVTEQALQLLEPNVYQTFLEKSQGTGSQPYYAYLDPLVDLMRSGYIDFAKSYDPTKTEDLVEDKDVELSIKTTDLERTTTNTNFDVVATTCEPEINPSTPLDENTIKSVVILADPVMEFEQ